MGVVATSRVVRSIRVPLLRLDADDLGGVVIFDVAFVNVVVNHNPTDNVVAANGNLISMSPGSHQD